MNTKRCFVIMPFSKTSELHTTQYWTTFFNEFLKPAVESLGYICERSKAGPNNIIDSVIKQLSEADCVIAVLSDYNANVWYELGIRHSLKKGTIMLIGEEQEVPFDILSYGVIRYNEELNEQEVFIESLKYFMEQSETGGKIDNPVQSFIEKENLIINETKLAKFNELLEGIDWKNVPIEQLTSFKEPKFYFHITNLESGKALDLSGSAKRNEAVVHLYTPHEGPNQIWDIRMRFGSLWTISSKLTGKCIEVKNASFSNETPIQQNAYRNSKNQHWRILINEDGSYRIICELSGKCLEADAQTVHNNGGRIIQYQYTDSPHQKWILRPIPITF